LPNYFKKQQTLCLFTFASESTKKMPITITIGDSHEHLQKDYVNSDSDISSIGKTNKIMKYDKTCNFY